MKFWAKLTAFLKKNVDFKSIFARSASAVAFREKSSIITTRKFIKEETSYPRTPKNRLSVLCPVLWTRNIPRILVYSGDKKEERFMNTQISSYPMN